MQSAPLYGAPAYVRADRLQLSTNMRAGQVADEGRAVPAHAGYSRRDIDVDV